MCQGEEALRGRETSNSKKHVEGKKEYRCTVVEKKEMPSVEPKKKGCLLRRNRDPQHARILSEKSKKTR